MSDELEVQHGIIRLTARRKIARALRVPLSHEAQVRRIVEEARAIAWLIDSWIAQGKTDEWIAGALPLGIQVIQGDITEGELRSMLEQVREGS